MRYAIFSVLAACLVFPLLAGTPSAEEGSSGKNPYAGKPEAAREGLQIFKANCEACHGPGGKGDICPNLTAKKKKYGNSDSDLFLTISKGRPGGMPNWENVLGRERIWKVITYLRSIEK